MDNGAKKITVGSTELTVTLPGFAEREELIVAWHTASTRDGGEMALRRVSAAALGLCTSTGRRAKVDYGACGCDPLVYGGRVYEWLHGQKVALSDILIAGGELVSICVAASFPREAEVAATEDFSGAAAAKGT
jgi:hypothetical protein